MQFPDVESGLQNWGKLITSKVKKVNEPICGLLKIVFIQFKLIIAEQFKI
jgi:hypothetical protein